MGTRLGGRPWTRLNYKGPENSKNPAGNRRFRTQIGPKTDEAKPKVPEAVPTKRNRPMPIDFGPVSEVSTIDPNPVPNSPASGGGLGHEAWGSSLDSAELKGPRK